MNAQDLPVGSWSHEPWEDGVRIDLRPRPDPIRFIVFAAFALSLCAFGIRLLAPSATRPGMSSPLAVLLAVLWIGVCLAMLRLAVAELVTSRVLLVRIGDVRIEERLGSLPLPLRRFDPRPARRLLIEDGLIFDFFDRRCALKIVDRRGHSLRIPLGVDLPSANAILRLLREVGGVEPPIRTG